MAAAVRAQPKQVHRVAFDAKARAPRKRSNQATYLAVGKFDHGSAGPADQMMAVRGGRQGEMLMPMFHMYVLHEPQVGEKLDRPVHTRQPNAWIQSARPPVYLGDLQVFCRVAQDLEDGPPRRGQAHAMFSNRLLEPRAHRISLRKFLNKYHPILACVKHCVHEMSGCELVSIGAIRKVCRGWPHWMAGRTMQCSLRAGNWSGSVATWWRPFVTARLGDRKHGPAAPCNTLPVGCPNRTFARCGLTFSRRVTYYHYPKQIFVWRKPQRLKKCA
jgi:hypothetical protein